MAPVMTGHDNGLITLNVAEADSSQVHFRDTMVGGKLLNQPRMAELHAQEAPARVNEVRRSPAGPAGTPGRPARPGWCGAFRR